MTTYPSMHVETVQASPDQYHTVVTTMHDGIKWTTDFTLDQKRECIKLAKAQMDFNIQIWDNCVKGLIAMREAVSDYEIRHQGESPAGVLVASSLYKSFHDMREHLQRHRGGVYFDPSDGHMRIDGFMVYPTHLSIQPKCVL